jgi:hypothetical protein
MEDEIEIVYHIHVYGEITPMDLVVASSTRTDNTGSPWEREAKFALWEMMERLHGNLDEYRGKTYAHHIRSLILHRHARFVTNNAYTLSFLQDKQSRLDPFEWTFDFPDPNSYEDSPVLDISHLRKDDVGCAETLQGCVWLLQTNTLMATEDFYPGAAVKCRSEMVLPLMKTVSSRTFVRICTKAENVLRSMKRRNHRSSSSPSPMILRPPSLSRLQNSSPTTSSPSQS